MMPCGIDTITAAIGMALPPDIRWEYQRTGTAGGGLRSSYNGWSSVDGLLIGFRTDKVLGRDGFQRSLLWVQASLPKVLCGHNVMGLHDQDAIAEAIARIDVIVSSFLGRSLDFTGWPLSRVDVTRDRLFQSDAHLNGVLSRLSLERIGQTYPHRMPGSLMWKRGRRAVTFRVYDKFRQCQLTEAHGVLRVEAQANGHEAIRMKYPEAVRPKTVTLGHLLQESATVMQESMISPVDRLLEQAIEQSVTDPLQTLLGVVGRGVPLSKVSRLIGVAILSGLFGWEQIGQWTTRQTIHNWRGELMELAHISDSEHGEAVNMTNSDLLDQSGESAGGDARTRGRGGSSPTSPLVVHRVFAPDPERAVAALMTFLALPYSPEPVPGPCAEEHEPVGLSTGVVHFPSPGPRPNGTAATSPVRRYVLLKKRRKLRITYLAFISPSGFVMEIPPPFHISPQLRERVRNDNWRVEAILKAVRGKPPSAVPIHKNAR